MLSEEIIIFPAFTKRGNLIFVFGTYFYLIVNNICLIMIYRAMIYYMSICWCWEFVLSFVLSTSTYFTVTFSGDAIHTNYVPTMQLAADIGRYCQNSFKITWNVSLKCHLATHSLIAYCKTSKYTNQPGYTLINIPQRKVFMKKQMFANVECISLYIHKYSSIISINNKDMIFDMQTSIDEWTIIKKKK